MTIRMKSVMLLAIVLSLSLVILSVVVLDGISRNQKEQREAMLETGAQTANSYLSQEILSATNKVPETYLQQNGEYYVERLTRLINRPVALYNEQMELVAGTGNWTIEEEKDKLAPYVRENKSAYISRDNQLFYLSPLRVEGRTVGSIGIFYDRSDEDQFYEQVRWYFVVGGLGVFAVGFLITVAYYGRMAVAIQQMNQMVNFIEKGNYEQKGIKRKDELGQLSQGISHMGKQIGEQFEALRQEQERQRVFMGNVTHEFKTPLTAMTAYLDLMEMYPDDANLRDEAYQTMQEETTRLKVMVDQILNVAATQSYSFQIKKTQVDVGALMKRVLLLLRTSLEDKKIKVEQAFESFMIVTDEQLLMHVLLNLMENGVKYNHKEGRIVLFGGKEDGHWWIEIADTGIGIPKEKQASIFDAFYRVDDDRSRETGGAGLGLSIVKDYISLLNGRILMVEKQGFSTVFRLEGEL